MRCRTALAALWLVGCPPNLDGFEVDEPGDGDGDGDGDTDGDGDADGDGDGDRGGPCAEPHLLVAVEDLEGGSGRVMRFELDPVRRCGDLTGGDEMLSQVLAIAWVERGWVAVAGEERVQMIDPEQDRILGQADILGQWAIDTFPLEWGDRPILGMALGPFAASGDVLSIRLYDADGGVEEEWATNGGDLPIGLGVTSVTRSPLHPDRILVMDPGEYAAAEVDLSQGIVGSDPPYASLRKGVVLASVSGLVDVQGSARVAWTGTDETGSHVYYGLNLSEGSSVSLPLGCADRTCDFVHAVPDPTLNTRLIALCEEGGDSRRRSVVRFTSTDSETCETLVPADVALPMTSGRLSRLAVAGPQP